MARSSLPMPSMGAFCAASRMGLNLGRPSSFSRDPLAGEGAVLDLLQHCTHILADVLVDDAVAAAEGAVLGGVADREVHVVVAALVHQVDDHLQLVKTFEVRNLLRVSGLDQRLEGGVDQGGHSAAEDALLAEQVALGLVLDGGFQHAGPGAADALGIGQSDCLALPVAS